MATTTVWGFTLLLEAQPGANAEYNLSLKWLDALTPQPSVIDRDLLTPPGSPSEGDLYQVALSGSPTGDWSTFANGDLALFTDSAWVSKTPAEGAALWVEDEDLWLVFDGTAWLPKTPIISHQIHADAAAGTVWTDQPATQTFLFGSYAHVTRLDLTGHRQVRLVVNKQETAAAASATLELLYKTSTFSTTVGDYSSIGTSAVSVGIDTTDTVLTSAWIDLASAAKADVFVAVSGTGGDGVIDPDFGSISAQFR